MSWVSIYFGENLLMRSGYHSTLELLKNKKFVAIYFSAHWCPPCRAFTPFLAEFYEQLREYDETALEVIFASSDDDLESFETAFSEMPWAAIPFDQLSFKDELSTRFNVIGIPSVIVVSLTDGLVKDRDARATIINCKGDVAKVMALWEKEPAGGPVAADSKKSEGKDDDDDKDYKDYKDQYKDEK